MSLKSNIKKDKKHVWGMREYNKRNVLIQYDEKKNGYWIYKDGKKVIYLTKKFTKKLSPKEYKKYKR
jgi:hypothetical protein